MSHAQFGHFHRVISNMYVFGIFHKFNGSMIGCYMNIILDDIIKPSLPLLFLFKNDRLKDNIIIL